MDHQGILGFQDLLEEPDAEAEIFDLESTVYLFHALWGGGFRVQGQRPGHAVEFVDCGVKISLQKTLIQCADALVILDIPALDFGVCVAQIGSVAHTCRSPITTVVVLTERLKGRVVVDRVLLSVGVCDCCVVRRDVVQPLVGVQSLPDSEKAIDITD